MERNRAIFLDRDGVINIDHGYTHRIADFALVDGAAAAIRRANAAGYLVLVVTNQGGIGLGYYGHEDVRLFHQHMQAELAREQALITDFAYCPHHPQSPDPAQQGCSCRKPSPGMLLSLAEKHDVDLAASAMIGDRDTDVEAGRAAGARGFLFDGGNLDPLMVRVLAELDMRETIT
ncbi:MAG: D-glycero-alpha-D-manno-heptose-1,7-bisphosphate 7-phosphatase [Candidatus Puniceispirillales bacterium]